MSNPRIVIEGQDEVVQALRRVEKFDKEGAGSEAAMRLLPAVRAGTRVKTGLLSASWDVAQSAFVNEVAYAVPQEFGTDDMEGAYATIRAWESGETDVIKAFEKEIENAAQQAGFNP